MLQAPFSDCLFLNLLSHVQNFCALSVMDVFGCEAILALVVTMVVLVTHEVVDLGFKIAGQETGFLGPHICRIGEDRSTIQSKNI